MCEEVSEHQNTLLVKRALLFVEKAFRNVEEPERSKILEHARQVAAILYRVVDDVDIIVAGLLHDVVEDTDTSPIKIAEEFGLRVADLVLEVTHEGQADSHGYYFPRLKSREGILIKFADRLSNLTRIDEWPEQRQKHYLKTSKFWKSEPAK